PVELRVVEQEGEAERHAHQRMAVAAAGFQQQHPPAAIGAQPVGQHAAGRAGADDHVIVAAARHHASEGGHWFMYTTLVSKYARRPSGPPARPIPDCLKPPNGKWVSITQPLWLTLPA